MFYEKMCIQKLWVALDQSKKEDIEYLIKVKYSKDK